MKPTVNMIIEKCLSVLRVFITSPSGNIAEVDSTGALKVQSTVVALPGSLSADVINKNSPVPVEYDSITITPGTYGPTTCVYKKSGATVATITITYDGSGNITGWART